MISSSTNTFRAGIRGMGACSASGTTLEEIVSSFRSEKSALAPLKKNTFILGDFSGGEIPFDCPLKDRADEILNLALQPALKEANLTSMERKRTGIFVGTTSGFMLPAELKTYSHPNAKEIFMRELTARGMGEVAYRAAKLSNTSGPLFTYSTACTSSAFALLEAYRLLKIGVIDHAIVIGYETLLNTTLHGFKSLMLYDPTGHRPFDKNRKGLQLGEGCGVVILDRESANTQFQLLGGASTNDHLNITGSDLSGLSAIKLLNAVCKNTETAKEEIVAIKAHGTGTLDNDLGEGVGFKKFFDKTPRFSSIKGYSGHTLGAAGAVEVASWLGCVAKGFIPKSAGFKTIDEMIGIAPMVETFGSTSGKYLFTYFGFGGSSVGLVIEAAYV